MHLTSHRSAAQGVTVITVSGTAAPGSGSTLRDTILAALLEPDTRAVVDLSSVEFLDSGMLSALVAATSAAGAARVAIVCPDGHRARPMFALTALDTMFAVCESRADAARALAAS